MARLNVARLAALALGASLVACGASEADSFGGADAGNGGTPECFSSNECPTGWQCSEFGVCVPPPAPPDPDGGTPPPPPPPEIEYELGQPVSSLRFVYVAMPQENALAKIDGKTLAVSSLAVGEHPEVVAAAPGTDTAVVLDSKNGVATIVRPTLNNDQKLPFRTLPNLNRLVIDPTGTYAVAWFDLNKAIADAGSLDQVDQLGSFQDVTILDLTMGAETSVDLTVGLRPREVEFDDAGTHAFVVTDDGVSVIDLAMATQQGPSIVPPIPFGGDPFADPLTIEVDVVATGAYAVVREAGQANVRVLSLLGPTAGQSWLIDLPSEPSDLDLAPDGATAYAVLREDSQLVVIDVPGDGFDPSGVETVDLGGEVVGSLVMTRDGSRGVLFTNATLSERIVVIDLATAGHPFRVYPLEKSIRHVQIHPSGRKAIIAHAKQAGSPGDATTFDEFIDRSYGYSVFDLDRGFAKLQITPVDTGSMAFAAAANRAYVSLDGGDAPGAIKQLQSIELDTGVVRSLPLGSPPDAVGVLPDASVAFVAQRHPLGRVSFIDITSGDVRTVTGFDLNSLIID